MACQKHCWFIKFSYVKMSAILFFSCPVPRGYNRGTQKRGREYIARKESRHFLLRSNIW